MLLLLLILLGIIFVLSHLPNIGRAYSCTYFKRYLFTGRLSRDLTVSVVLVTDKVGKGVNDVPIIKQCG